MRKRFPGIMWKKSSCECAAPHSFVTGLNLFVGGVVRFFSFRLHVISIFYTFFSHSNTWQIARFCDSFFHSPPHAFSRSYHHHFNTTTNTDCFSIQMGPSDGPTPRRHVSSHYAERWELADLAFKVVSISELVTLGEGRRIKWEEEQRRKLRKFEEAGKKGMELKREGEVMKLNKNEDGDVSPGMWIVECCCFCSPNLFRSLHW